MVKATYGSGTLGTVAGHVTCMGPRTHVGFIS